MRALLLALALLSACDQPSACEEDISLDKDGRRIEPFSQAPGEWCNRDKDCEGNEFITDGKTKTGDGWCLAWKNSCARPCKYPSEAECADKYGPDVSCGDVAGRALCQ